MMTNLKGIKWWNEPCPLDGVRYGRNGRLVDGVEECQVSAVLGIEKISTSMGRYSVWEIVASRLTCGCTVIKA